MSCRICLSKDTEVVGGDDRFIVKCKSCGGIFETHESVVDFHGPVSSGPLKNNKIFDHGNFFSGERDDVVKVVEIAERWGYGNLIAHLRHAWAKKLMSDGISKEAAIAATNSSSYPV